MIFFLEEARINRTGLINFSATVIFSKWYTLAAFALNKITNDILHNMDATTKRHGRIIK